jgi:hypothetical protein
MVPPEVITTFSSTRIDKAPEFFSLINSYFTDAEKYQAHWLFFNEKKLRIPDQIISYRVINYWEMTGIIKSGERQGAEWRKYSVMDTLWISIVKLLLGFGLKAKDIVSIRKHLLISVYEQSEYGLLEFYSLLAVFSKRPVEILIFPDFTAEIGGYYEISEYKDDAKSMIHLSLNLNSILQKVLPQNDLTPLYDKTLILDEKEAKILLTIKENKYKEIRLIFLNGEAKTIEATETISGKRNVAEQINKGGYARIEVVQENGKVVSLERTLKIPL